MEVISTGFTLVDVIAKFTVTMSRRTLKPLEEVNNITPPLIQMTGTIRMEKLWISCLFLLFTYSPLLVLMVKSVSGEWTLCNLKHLLKDILRVYSLSTGTKIITLFYLLGLTTMCSSGTLM